MLEVDDFPRCSRVLKRHVQNANYLAVLRDLVRCRIRVSETEKHLDEIIDENYAYLIANERNNQHAVLLKQETKVRRIAKQIKQ